MWTYFFGWKKIFIFVDKRINDDIVFLLHPYQCHVIPLLFFSMKMKVNDQSLANIMSGSWRNFFLFFFFFLSFQLVYRRTCDSKDGVIILIIRFNKFNWFSVAFFKCFFLLIVQDAHIILHLWACILHFGGRRFISGPPSTCVRVSSSPPSIIYTEKTFFETNDLVDFEYQ